MGDGVGVEVTAELVGSTEEVEEEGAAQDKVEQLTTGPNQVPPANRQRAQLHIIQLLSEVQQPPTPS